MGALRAGSTFSGVGGLDLGLRRAGLDHAFFAELDPWRRAVLAAHWPGVDVYDDVHAVRSGAGPVDVLAGGFPCQDVSIAGHRRGLAGARSGLFFEFARIAADLQPRWLLVENVPGLLTANGGRDFGCVLAELADLGYGVAWRHLDARYFGVAQRRRRVFLVGHLGGRPELALRCLDEGSGGHLEAGVCTWQAAA
ncbi:MAG TPA: DNA (cytosine-5-)-methyltransferase, partial [Dehalococcoidia bacterium]|nr:DNA (cytosine-5-)-methyltransferase [Dehalococcoidia bacterium]